MIAEKLARINKNSSLYKTLLGLNGVLQHLTSLVPIGNNDRQLMRSSMPFDEAYEVFNSFFPYKGFTNQEKQQFRDALLHPEYGLRVSIFTNPVGGSSEIILRPNSIDIEPFLIGLTERLSSKPQEEDIQLVHGILNSFDTEWDRKCATALLGMSRSWNDLIALGIDPRPVSESAEQIKSVLSELENTKTAASDMINLRLKEKESKIQLQLQQKRDLRITRNGVWPVDKLDDLQKEIEALDKRLQEVRQLIAHQDEPEIRKFNQMVKRLASQLSEENRLKRRSLSSGRPRLLNEEVEDFIAQCIEQKAASHGRRHDTVLYTGRRVKVKDLLHLANHKLEEQGKPLIRSAVTVSNLSRPRNKRSRQAKLHTGRGLFCTKKPYKSEDASNKNTHHQRAHVLNVKRFFCSDRNKEIQPFTFIRSIDDKAYLRPGTSEGFCSARNTRILAPSAVARARKLPKYDWPQKMFYQTPSTHKILKNEAVNIDGVERIKSVGDRHIVYVRPKAYVDSSGTTWANETVQMRHDIPEEFEIRIPDSTIVNRSQYSKGMRKVSSRLHDNLYLFTDMSEKDDVQKVSRAHNCPYRSYEHLRLVKVKNAVHEIHNTFNNDETISTAEKESLQALNLNNLLDKISDLEKRLSDKNVTALWGGHQECTALCNGVLQQLHDLGLPYDVKPIWADLTDAGPGVGISNFEVRFRDAEMARMWNSDYRIRVHRSRNDSHMNEAERTNSAIGDALVDGGTIEWERHRLFDGLTDDQISQLTLNEFEEHQRQIIRKNALEVTDDVVNRLDGAPALGEFISAYRTPIDENEQFFFNKNSIAEQTSSVPGAAYIDKICDFFNKHYIRGELYMEFVKQRCKTTAGRLYSYCSKHDWRSPKSFDGIPAPYPDYEKLPKYHYKDVFDTSLLSEDNTVREIDDFLPRARLKCPYRPNFYFPI